MEDGLRTTISMILVHFYRQQEHPLKAGHFLLMPLKNSIPNILCLNLLTLKQGKPSLGLDKKEWGFNMKLVIMYKSLFIKGL